jgi:hypothetical protein
MISKVISGGQTGADQAGLRAAKKAGIPTAGYIPWGYLTEKGYHPELREEFDLIETEETTYPPRTQYNIEFADALLWFGNTRSPGGRLTIKLANDKGMPYLCIPNPHLPPDSILGWLRGINGRLMIAGNRESTNLGIGKWVEEFLDEVFRLLKESK